MDKLILMLIMVATVAIPAFGARMSARRGLGFTVLGMVVFLIVYFFLVIFLMPRFM